MTVDVLVTLLDATESVQGGVSSFAGPTEDRSETRRLPSTLQ